MNSGYKKILIFSRFSRSLKNRAASSVRALNFAGIVLAVILDSAPFCASAAEALYNWGVIHSSDGPLDERDDHRISRTDIADVVERIEHRYFRKSGESIEGRETDGVAPLYEQQSKGF